MDIESMDRGGLPQGRPFYGYWIIAASFVIMVVFGGFGLYVFGLFVKPLEDAFGWSRAGIMLANTASIAVRGLSAVLIGKLIDRHDPKWIFAGGSAFAGVMFMAAAAVSDLRLFILFFGLSGLGLSAISFGPVTAVIFRWFDKYRGRAVGISGAGTGFGGLVMAPAIGAFLIPRFGWRIAMAAMGASMILLIVPLALIVIKSDPRDMGLRPDGSRAAGDDIARNSSAKTAYEGLTLRQAVGTSAFWLILLACASSGVPMIALLQHQAAHLQDIGFPLVVAASALGAVGLVNAIGKPIFGFLTEAVDAKYAMAIGLGVQLIALVLLMNLMPSSPGYLIWVYAICLGLGMGSWVPTMSMLVTENFGMLAYGTIFGAISLINTIGSSLGPLFAGWVFDVHGNYRIAFLVFAMFYAIAIIMALLIRKPRIY